MSTSTAFRKRFQDLGEEARVVECFRDTNIDASVIVLYRFQRWALSVLDLLQDVFGKNDSHYTEFERNMGIAIRPENSYITRNYYQQFLAIFEAAKNKFENGFFTRTADSHPRDGMSPDKKKVFIIHGRNSAARIAIEHFVKAVDLVPIDFDELAADQGGSAFVGEIVRAGLSQAQGIIAVFTPDESAALRAEYVGTHEKAEDIQRWQARPNVIFEAGMAYGMAPKRTILVTLGTDVALFSDVSGVHILRLNNQRESRSQLRNKLIGVNCDVNQRTDAWADQARSGNFESCINLAFKGSPQETQTIEKSRQQSLQIPEQASPLTDDEYIAIIYGWFEKLSSEERGQVIYYEKVDTLLNFSPGTAQKFIIQVAKEFHREVARKGPNLVLFKYVPPPVPSGSSNFSIF